MKQNNAIAFDFELVLCHGKLKLILTMALLRKEAVEHQNDFIHGDIIIPSSFGVTFSAAITGKLLARALNKKPGFLLLDEATSRLDVESEIEKSQTLRQMGLPVLLIAHRPETIASADWVLYLADGFFTELNHQSAVGESDLVCDHTDEWQVKYHP